MNTKPLRHPDTDRNATNLPVTIETSLHHNQRNNKSSNGLRADRRICVASGRVHAVAGRVHATRATISTEPEYILINTRWTMAIRLPDGDEPSGSPGSSGQLPETDQHRRSATLQTALSSSPARRRKPIHPDSRLAEWIVMGRRGPCHGYLLFTPRGRKTRAIFRCDPAWESARLRTEEWPSGRRRRS